METLAIVDWANALGDAAREAAHRPTGGRPDLVQRRAQEAYPCGDAPQGAVGDALRDLLDDVGTVPSHGRPASGHEPLLYSRIAQLPDDDPAPQEGLTECPTRALREPVGGIPQHDGTESAPHHRTHSTIT